MFYTEGGGNTMLIRARAPTWEIIDIQGYLLPLQGAAFHN